MTDTDDRWFNVGELRASAEHGLTDSRTRAQLFWAADRIAELEAEKKRLREEVTSWLAEAELLSAPMNGGNQ